MDKKAVRKEVAEKKKQMTGEQISELSAQLKELFCSLEEYKKTQVLYAYMSYNQEVRTIPIIKQAWADGKRVAVPKTINKEYMEFIYIDSLDELEKGYMGIPEPPETLLNDPERIADEKDVLILMPGLAFDKDLNRTGYGGGFYDKYLAQHPESTFIKVALCFDFQIYEHLETEAHDEKMDLVVSNTRAYRKRMG